MRDFIVIDYLEMRVLLMGHSELIFGSMYAGKTEELIRRLKRYQLSGKQYQLFKPKVDNRYGDDIVTTHNYVEEKDKILKIIQLHIGNIFNRAKLINDLYKSLGNAIIAEVVSKSMDILSLVKEDTNVVGIDEVQFFDEDIINVIDELKKQNKIVIITGLDMYASNKPFGNIVPYLACTSKYVTKLHAVCMDCGRDAYISYKLTNTPADKIDIGSYGKYIALCEQCAEKRERQCGQQLSEV